MASLWPAKRAQRFLKRLTPAQDALGHHNDEVVAAEKFRLAGQQDPRSYFAAGFLLGHQGVTARAARVALGDITAAPRFWKR